MRPITYLLAFLPKFSDIFSLNYHPQVKCSIVGNLFTQIHPQTKYFYSSYLVEIVPFTHFLIFAFNSSPYMGKDLSPNIP